MSAEKDQYLIFHLGLDRYALTVGPVREVVEQPSLIRLPHAPPYVLGVFQREERTVPVLDLCVKWDMPLPPAQLASCIIVVEGMEGPFAIRADNVTAIVTLRAGDVQALPEAARTRRNREAVTGIAKLAGADVVVLNLEGLATNVRTEA